MKSSHLILLTAGILAASTATLLACIWDTDTLAAERSRLPDIAELISGSFPRHSREFHEWRSDHCKKLIASRAANVSTYDRADALTLSLQSERAEQ